MIDGLRPYAAYRASPDRWLTQFPSTWERVRIKYLLREIDRRTQTGQEPLLSMRRDHGLVPLSQFSDKVAEPKALLAYKLVRPGELVVNRMQAGNGLVFVARIPGLISPDYAIFRPVREVNLDYLELLFRSYPMRAKFRSESTGLGTGTAGFLRLYGDSLGAIELGLPSADEQSQIVRFINHADRQIRRYIGVKKKLIALLNEQKQVIIHRAVMRGLDESKRLKTSGTNWLGDISECFDVLPLKRLIAFGTSISYGIVQPGDDVPNGIPFLQTTNISKPRLTAEGLQRTSTQIEAGYPRSRLDAGDVVLGIRASIGAAHVVPPELAGANLSRGIARIVPGPRLTSWYLVAYLQSKSASIFWELAKQGTTFNEISIETVRALPVVVPPKNMQFEIVRVVEAQCASVTRAIDATQREISLLIGCRTRIICDVVTGKIDVREAAAHLPDASTTSEVEGLLAEAAAESDAADLDDAEAEVIA